ncbi:MAG: signal peptidase II [bacterium]
MRLYLIAGLIVIIDQISKIIIKESMYLGQSIELAGNFLKITYIENPGIAFGIRVGSPIIFTILSLLASIGILMYIIYNRNGDKVLKYGLTIILGGALGNLIDRLFMQRVVDFIDVGIGSTRWPVFNVADSAVVIGMFILIYTMIKIEKEEKNSQLIKDNSSE